MTLEDIKGLGRVVFGCLGIILIYGLLITWAASGEGIGFGILALGLYLGYRINAAEDASIKRQERMNGALYEQNLALREMHQEAMMALDQLQSDVRELVRER